MKIAFIGCRGHLGYVFNEMNVMPELEVCGLCAAGDAPDRLTVNLEKLGYSAPLFDDYRELIDTVKPDIAVVSGPWHLHAPMSLYCLERGVDVFCEKPVAFTLEEVDALEQAAAKTGAKFGGMMGMRFESHFHTALKMINDNLIGDIQLIYTRKSYVYGTRPDFYNSRATYGGTIPWVGSHAIDLIQHCNAGDFASVRAWHCHRDNNAELPELTAHCAFTMTSGALASADIDYLRPAAAGSHGDDRLRAVGSAGIIEVTYGKIEIIDADGTREIIPEMPRYGVFGDFVYARHDAARKLTADNLRLTRACLYARESADLNKELTF